MEMNCENLPELQDMANSAEQSATQTADMLALQQNAKENNVDDVVGSDKQSAITSQVQKPKTTSNTKRNKRIFDTDSEDEHNDDANILAVPAATAKLTIEQITALVNAEDETSAGEQANNSMDSGMHGAANVSAQTTCPKGRKKVYMLSDSSDDEANNTLPSLVESSASETTEASAPITNKKRKKKVFMQKDSDDEDSASEQSMMQQLAKPVKISALIDSDSDAEEFNAMPNETFFNSKQNNKAKTAKSTKQKQKHVKATTNDASNSKVKQKKAIKSKSKFINDEEQQDNLSEAEHNYSSNEDEERTTKPSAKEKAPKQMRKSAKKAMEEMMAIQSEQQRLHREAYVSVPYHKPKQHTLQEFLSRRTIIKPDATKEESPLAVAIRNKRTRMTEEELIEYARLMEERAKEAAEFYKSESEEDEETANMTMKDNDGILDNATTLTSQLSTEEPIVTEKTQKEMPLEVEQQQTEPTVKVDITDDAAADIFAQADKIANELDRATISSNILVTDVLELPKLDMSKLHIVLDSIDAVPSTNTKTTKLAQNIQRIIAEQNITDSPTIQGSADMDIDLETGDFIAKTTNGADELLQRLLATNKGRKTNNAETMNILSMENGNFEISKIKVNVQHELGCSRKDAKPGEAYEKLKKNLFKIIRQERMAERQKRIEEAEAAAKKEYSDYDDDDDDVEAYDDEVETDTDKENKTKPTQLLIDEDENVALIEDDNDVNETTEIEGKCKKVNSSDDETEEEENKSESSDSDDEDSESVQTTSTDVKYKTKRIIKAFQNDSDDADDDYATPIPPPIPFSMPTRDDDAILNFGLDSQLSNIADDDISSLVDLCSGKFSLTQDSSEKPKCKTTFLADANDELLQLCSGTFDDFKTQPLQTQQDVMLQEKSEDSSTPVFSASVDLTLESDTIKPFELFSSDNTASWPALTQFKQQIISSDDEAAKSNANTTKRRKKRLNKKLKKGQVKLGFSDEEDDDDENEDDEDEEDTDDAEQNANNFEETNNANDEEVPDTFIDYDSDENEVIVQMTKKDRVKEAENFFENEAELSESDWGSADEDEKNMDKYDIELGDEDEFDKEQLQSELGKIHARKMLDQDIREVRKLQEIYLEDEETDGVGRQRQFKWKNAERGFSLDYNNCNENDENVESGEDEDEQLCRKMRFEREQLLKQQNQVTSVDATLLKPLSANKKINIITAKKTHLSLTTSTSTESRKSSPFLISNQLSVLHKKTARSSFLVRDNVTLQKLAGLAKASADEEKTAGSVPVKTIAPKNFVFSALTEEERECLKRKSAELLNNSSELMAKCNKKLRLDTNSNMSLFDQLP